MVEATTAQPKPRQELNALYLQGVDGPVAKLDRTKGLEGLSIGRIREDSGADRAGV